MDDAAKNTNKTFLIVSYVLILIFPIASLILALVKKAECKEEPVLASHISNQLKIMLWAIIWSVVLFILGIILSLILPFVGSILTMLIFGGLYIWIIYRVIKGASKLASYQLA